MRLMTDEDIAALQSLVRRFRSPLIVEVGSWLGASALAMVDAGAFEVHCVDTWLGTDDPADMTYAVARRRGQTSLFSEFLVNVGDRIGQEPV